MYQVKRSGQVVYEDLMRELEVIEHQLLPENSALAMNLMVLEAKIRERFQHMDSRSDQNAPTAHFFANDDALLDDIRDLIPKDLDAFPDMDEIERRRRRKRTLETVGMAAILAMATALGVFGLASILQMALSWMM